MLPTAVLDQVVGAFSVYRSVYRITVSEPVSLLVGWLVGYWLMVNPCQPYQGSAFSVGSQVFLASN